MSTVPAPKRSAKQQRIEAHDDFVRYVVRQCLDLKAQADLRSGLGLPVERCTYLHRYLVPRLPQQQAPGVRRAHYAVAALIAGRPRTARDADAVAASERDATPEAGPAWWRRSNLGASLAEAVKKGALKPASAEGDLHLMTRQRSTAIHPRLPSLTRHLLTNDVRLDWAILLDDLSWWDQDRDRIATRWLESYFRILSSEDSEQPTDAHTDPQELN